MNRAFAALPRSGRTFLGCVFLRSSFSPISSSAIRTIIPYATQLRAGPLFIFFAIYFFATTAWGIYNIELARRRTLTPTSRRRLRRLGFAFLAPALGVFPYLVFAGFPALMPPLVLLLLTFFGTIGLVLMLVVMAYTVAYEGALAPDRIIKQKFIHFMLRGPVLAVGVVTVLTIVPIIESWVPVSRDTLLGATIIVGIITFEMLISRSKPYIDRVLFWQDRREVKQIQELDARLLTTTDLRQLLENILAAMCDLLRVQSGFILAADADGWKPEALVGAREPVQKFMAGQTTPPTFSNGDSDSHHFFVVGDYWLYPLKSNGGDTVVGVIGVAARVPAPDLSEHERELVDALASQAELAIQDRLLQKSVFEALEQIGTEVALLQRAQSKPRVVGGTAQERVQESSSPRPISVVRSKTTRSITIRGGPNSSTRRYCSSTSSSKRSTRMTATPTPHAARPSSPKPSRICALKGTRSLTAPNGYSTISSNSK